jgi:hypothetical protein
MVAPAERRERSTMASLQGKPISRMACGSTVPSLMAEIHCGAWAQRELAVAGTWFFQHLDLRQLPLHLLPQHT